MADETNGSQLVIPKRTSDRAEELYNAYVELLLKKMKDGSATASEQKNALDYLRETGLRPIVGSDAEAGAKTKTQDLLERLRKREDTEVPDADGVKIRFG